MAKAKDMLSTQEPLAFNNIGLMPNGYITNNCTRIIPKFGSNQAQVGSLTYAFLTKIEFSSREKSEGYDKDV